MTTAYLSEQNVCSSLGALQQIPSEILHSIVAKLSAKDLASLESACFFFRQPQGVLPNRRASALEIFAFEKCKSYGGVWNLPLEKWMALVKRCDVHWKRVLHFLQAVERARGGRFEYRQASSQVATGCYQTLTVTAEGRLVSFGKDYPLSIPPSARVDGDDGPAEVQPLPAPTDLPASSIGGARLSSVAVGQSHVLLLDNKGQVYAYGTDQSGRLGLGSELVDKVVTEPTQVQFPDGVVCQQVSAGLYHSVALSTEGHVYAWGKGSEGRIGTVDMANQSTPTLVQQLKDKGAAVQVAAGASHTLVLMESGEVYSFGVGSYRSIATPDVLTPIDFLNGGGIYIVSIAAGEGTSAAIDSDGYVYTWGDNYCGALGHDHENSVSRPTLVEALKSVRIVQVTMKKRKTLFLADTGRIYAVGWAATGALGINHFGKMTKPWLVDLPNECFVQISAGWYHSVGITEKGRLLGFGDNEHGQLGIETKVDNLFRSRELMVGLPV